VKLSKKSLEDMWRKDLQEFLVVLNKDDVAEHKEILE
jgi:hypothetical protein